MIKHAAGWLHGGLTASLEKLIIDAEILQMVAARLEPFEVDADIWRWTRFAKSAPGAIFSAASIPASATRTRSTRRFHPTGAIHESGAVGTEQRANRIWKQLLQQYEQPPLAPEIDEALRD